MVKSKLVRAIHKKLPEIQLSEVEAAVNRLLKHMADASTKGEGIEIRGFGGLDLRYRPPRIARDPKTGEAITLPAKIALHFKPGKDLKDRVNASRDQCNIEE